MRWTRNAKGCHRTVLSMCRESLRNLNQHASHGARLHASHGTARRDTAISRGPCQSDRRPDLDLRVNRDMLIAKEFHDIPSPLDGGHIRVFVISPVVPNYPQAKFPGKL
jgi:hypothetical protein